MWVQLAELVSGGRKAGPGGHAQASARVHTETCGGFTLIHSPAPPPLTRGPNAPSHEWLRLRFCPQMNLPVVSL